MALLEVEKLGSPILRKIAEPVTLEEVIDPLFQSFIDDMVETMEKFDGVGLAAPQVSKSKQVIVACSNDNARYAHTPDFPLLVLLNPSITPLSEVMIDSWEGCLSVQDLRGKVSRYAKIAVEGFDRRMTPVTFEVEGFLAIVIQHEIDHLNGKVFLDRMSDLSTLSHLEEFKRYWLPQSAKV